MICAFLARLFLPIDWRGPWTTSPRGGGPMLDELLASRDRPITIARADGQRLRIGMWFTDGQVPR